MFEHGIWHNEPRRWTKHDSTLQVTTDSKSDFWRETYYGFTRDSGHLFATSVAGDFTASLRVRAQYRAFYDQAGIMVRIDEHHWIKAGIEISDGVACIGSVLTIGRSDWSTAAFQGQAEDFHLRVTVKASVLRLQYSTDGLTWPLLRLCPFPQASSYLVGPMCCTPEREGLEVEFSEFRLGPPLDKALHDLS